MDELFGFDFVVSHGGIMGALLETFCRGSSKGRVSTALDANTTSRKYHRNIIQVISNYHSGHIRSVIERVSQALLEPAVTVEEYRFASSGNLRKPLAVRAT